MMMSLMCAAVIVEVLKGVPPMDDRDNKVLERAKTRCSFYYPNSPCLKRFIKKDVNLYNAICGVKQ